MAAFAAVDIGASGGRVMRGVVEKQGLKLEPVHRFHNGVVETDGHLRWDIDTLFHHVQDGLRKIPEAESIGIDTWGVDYGVLDASGSLMALPIAYRDSRTADVPDEVHAAVSPEELYALTGTQFLPFNTIYQLAVERHGPLWGSAAQVVLLPDLLAFWLTGELRTELTNASTTGLLDARTHTWSATLLEVLGIDDQFFPALEPPGRRRGTTADGLPVTTVGSHDTASAVVGVPATTKNFAYVASGTWSLVGLEVDAPILSEGARRANFTNELGVGGRTRFLRNIGGLWLLQECLRSWQRADLVELVDAAAQVPPNGARVDVNDPSFIAPGAMPERITRAAGRTSMSPPQVTRCIIESLAISYADTVHRAATLAGRPVDVVHIVGGGSQNALLCQLTADACDLPVLAGPVEATAVGNVLVQAAALGAVPQTLEALRELVSHSISPTRYDPC